MKAAGCRVCAAARLRRRSAFGRARRVSAAGGNGWLSLAADPVAIDPDQAVAVGVIVTELIINAMKHAYPSGEGPVRVALHTPAGSGIRLCVEDDGIGSRPPSTEGSTELGQLIIEAMAVKLALFLDEIGELNFDLQAKLLKALEDKAIRRVGGERMIPNVHVVVEQPQSAGASGRKSLPGGSLSPPQVFHLDLPPLRVRKANIDEIVDGLIREFNAIAGKRVKRVPEAVRALLAAYVERSVLLSTGKELPAEWLQITPGGSLATTMASGDVISLPLDGSMSFDTMEKLIVEAALQRDGYNVMAAARRLGPKSSPAGWSITSARVTSSRSSPRCCFSR